jgi:hypothetical protein
MRILPSRDAVGLHGKTSAFTGFDEIHGFRNYDIFGALALDPTRPDALWWITSYDTIWNAPGTDVGNPAAEPLVSGTASHRREITN